MLMGIIIFLLICYIIYLRIRTFHVKIALESKVYSAWQNRRINRDDAEYLQKWIKKI